MRHEFVDIFHFRIIALKPFHKTLYITFFKIELTRIILRNKYQQIEKESVHLMPE